MSTAEVQAVPSRKAPWQRFVPMLVAVTVICGLGVWLIPRTPEGTWMRWLAWAAVPVVTFATVRLIRSSRSGKMFRR